MTKLLKIESYVECCHYARLFDRNPDDFIPTSDDLPIAYKGFLETASDVPYINHTVLGSELATELNTSKKAVNNYIGHDVNDSSSNKLLIVRDSNILSLRQLRQQYLYASAYHYWNYVSQISEAIDLQKHQVVFVDLDAFTPAARIPIEFRESDSTSHLIPILDTRKIGTYDSLNLEFDPKTVYKNICDRLAQEIIKKNSVISSAALSSISSYLQEINFFFILQSYLVQINQAGNFFQAVKSIFNSNSKNINFLIKFSQNNQDYYTKTELEIDQIDQIVTELVGCESLLNFARTNSNYKIVLISQYNFLPKFSRTLSTSFYLPNINKTEFDQIWQQKQITNFPLFGQYLDKISFEVGVEPNTFWIDVPSETETNIISYQGVPKMQRFIGQYQKGNEIKNSFPMKKPTVNLPIKINDQTLLNSGIEQVYQLTNQYFEQTPQITVTVSFSIRLGYQPFLEVRDNEDRSIENKLIDKIEYISTSKTIDFIPFKEILGSRLGKLELQKVALTNRLDINKLRDSITDLKQNNIKSTFASKVFITNISAQASAKNLYQFFKDDCLRFVDFGANNPHSSELLKLITNFDLVGDLKEATQHLANHLTKLKNPEKLDRARNTYNYLILILGKMYGISECLNLDFLFDTSYLPFHLAFNSDEYIKVLARIAKKNILCEKYLSLFDQNCRSKDNNKYNLLGSYIWGYARVLVWYLDFKNALDWLSYRHHFICIANNLFTEKQKSYRQDAFISLIYLLTFREFNPNFCGLNSQEYTLALRVVDRFSNDPVYSSQVSKETSLNETFAKLLEGTATVQETVGLLDVE